MILHFPLKRFCDRFCFISSCWRVYDAELCSTLSQVLNIDFSIEPAWFQATLPVCFGGIGV